MSLQARLAVFSAARIRDISETAMFERRAKPRLSPLHAILHMQHAGHHAMLHEGSYNTDKNTAMAHIYKVPDEFSGSGTNRHGPRFHDLHMALSKEGYTQDTSFPGRTVYKRRGSEKPLDHVELDLHHNPDKRGNDAWTVTRAVHKISRD